MSVNYIITAADSSVRLYQTRQSIQSQHPVLLQTVFSCVIWVMILQFEKYNLKLRALIEYDRCVLSWEILREVKNKWKKKAAETDDISPVIEMQSSRDRQVETLGDVPLIGRSCKARTGSHVISEGFDSTRIDGCSLVLGNGGCV